jgi:hypothetical protein
LHRWQHVVTLSALRDGCCVHRHGQVWEDRRAALQDFYREVGVSPAVDHELAKLGVVAIEDLHEVTDAMWDQIQAPPRMRQKLDAQLQQVWCVISAV